MAPGSPKFLLQGPVRAVVEGDSLGIAVDEGAELEFPHISDSKEWFLAYPPEFVLHDQGELADAENSLYNPDTELNFSTTKKNSGRGGRGTGLTIWNLNHALLNEEVKRHKGLLLQSLNPLNGGQLAISLELHHHRVTLPPVIHLIDLEDCSEISQR